MAGPIRTKESSPRNSPKPYSSNTHPQSPWRILNLFNFLNPLRGSNEIDESNRPIEDLGASFANTPTPDIQEISPGTPAEVLAQRGQEMADALAAPSVPEAPAPQIPDPVTPVRSNPHPRLSKSSSPEDNIITVVNFLKEKVNQTVSEVEVSGMIHLLEQVVPAITVPEVREPFRFSRNIPPAGHDDATNDLPREPPTFYSKDGVATASTMPPRMLSTNPNGTYYWYGGGSSKVPPKPRINRYSSPAFGPARPKESERFIILDIDRNEENGQKKTDKKRRRVEVDKAESSSQSAGPPPAPVRAAAPAPSPTRASQSHAAPLPTPRATSAHVNGASSSAAAAPPVRSAYASPSARRTTVFSKPPLRDTAPAKPSPLRQAWGQSQSSASTSSPPESPQSRPAELPRPNRSVAFMTALIKEVTPVERPQVRNPYQDKRYVKINYEGKKRPRFTPKKPEPPKDIDEEYSPQMIIEATVPPGSKRSRPPAHFEKRPAASSVSSTMDVEPSRTLAPPPAPPAVRRSPRMHGAQLPQQPSQSEPAPTNGRPKPPVVVIVDDDDEVDELKDDEEEVRTTKKQKQEHVSFASSSSAFQPTPAVNGSGNSTEERTKPPTITIEEVDDVDMPLAQKPKEPIRPAIPPAEPINDWNRYAKDVSAPKASSSSSGLSQPVPVRSAFGYNPMKSSAPKEPSKLRYSYKADLPSPPARPSAPAPPSEAPIRSFSRAPGSDDMAIDTPVASRSGATDPKDTARAMDVDSLPKPTFAYPAFASSSWNETREAVHSVPLRHLPRFNFRAAPANVVRAPAKPAASGANWKCGLCGLQNPADALDKCTICENPR